MNVPHISPEPGDPDTGDALVPAALRAEVLATLHVPSASVWKGPNGGWLLHTATQLLAVDEDLAVLAEFPLPRPRERGDGIHGVSADLTVAVLSLRESIRAIDTAGKVLWEVTHHPWGNSDSESGSAVVTPARLVWATTPSSEGSNHWLTIDLATGLVLSDVAIDCYAAGSEPLVHPDGHLVGLSVGEGQDRCAMFWGRFDGSQAHVQDGGREDRVLVDIRPNGCEFLTTPHVDGSLCRHDLTAGAILTRVEGADVFGHDEDGYEKGFDFAAGYLDNDLVLASSYDCEPLVLLTASDLAVIGEVAMPPEVEPGYFVTNGRGRWVMVDSEAAWLLRVSGPLGAYASE